MYNDYEVTIGIEVHVQLNTKSKIFCTCSNGPAGRPNSNICQICAGHPGVLPVLNKQVVQAGIQAGLATHCTINKVSEFARKHYFYPDLPKNYQITQADKPLCANGYVTIGLEDGQQKNIRIMRIHMEEDAGKNIHSAVSDESFVDLNRAGTPLLEIVTQPDIASSYQARTYLKALRNIVMYLDICSGNMEEGAFRADTNISVRKKGATQFGTRVELKNINSFKFISDAIEYEIVRQIDQLESGNPVRQETRLWDTKLKKTVIMRSKEEAADYRYFPDPDLPLVVVDPEWLQQVTLAMPELPDQKFARFVTQHGLSANEAEILINDRAIADYYESAYAQNPVKQIINWVLRDVMGFVKEAKIDITQLQVTPQKLAQLVDLVAKGTINNAAAKEVFELIAQSGGQPLEIVKQRGLEQVGASPELEQIIKDIINANGQQVAQYRAANAEQQQKLLGYFIGITLKKTQGKGNPKIVQELLKKALDN